MERGKRDILFEDGVWCLNSNFEDQLENQADQGVHQNLVNMNVSAGF